MVKRFIVWERRNEGEGRDLEGFCGKFFGLRFSGYGEGVVG